MEEIDIYKGKVSTAVKLNNGRVPNELMPKTIKESTELMVMCPKEYYSSMKPSCIKEVLNSNVCSIAVLNKENGYDSVLAVLTIILVDLVTFFNIGKNMSTQQVMMTAEMIYNDYYFFKIDEFKLCFDRAKKGLYGEVFGVDGSVIYKWLNAYSIERDALCEEMNVNSKPPSEFNCEKYMYEFKRLERAYDAKNKTK